jgi:hypothetical protein
VEGGWLGHSRQDPTGGEGGDLTIWAAEGLSGRHRGSLSIDSAALLDHLVLKKARAQIPALTREREHFGVGNRMLGVSIPQFSKCS